MSRLLAVAMVLGLAACAGAPTRDGTAPAGADGRKAAKAPRKSPYPPAREDPSKRGDYTAGGLYAPGVDDTAPEGPIDVSLIPEPEVVALPRSRYGNRETYSVLGKQYHVLDDAEGYVARGIASYYGTKFHGRRTSNMEVYDMYAFTAAHKTLPLPSFARVTNLDNGRSVVVRVNDRGPFHEGRIIDLSYAAAVKLGVVQAGTAPVEVRALMPGDEAEQPLYAREANNPPPADAGAAGASPAAAAPSAMDRLVDALPVAAAGAVELPPGVRIATGKPARMDRPRTDPSGIAGSAAADRPPPAADAGTAANAATGRYGDGAAATAPLAGSPSAADGVVLQVAAFSTRDNAERALATLREAGIERAHVLDGQSDGRAVWRLRVGPLEADASRRLGARIVDLGFGPPQQVAE